MQNETLNSENFLPPLWCLVGNIKRNRPTQHSNNALVHHYGTKHFSGGTKVYCFPAQWGDGYEKIVAIAKHRGSSKLVAMIISTNMIENWRVRLIYSPKILNRIGKICLEKNYRFWQSKDAILPCYHSLIAFEQQ